jgi:magnesium chelatase family protein
MVQKYINRVSGPLMDRIDIQLEVVPVPFRNLDEKGTSEKSETIRDRVIRARQIQEARLKEFKGIYCNAQMSSRMVREFVALDHSSRELLKTAMEKLGLSARAYDRILKVSRTIADLEGSEKVESYHLSEAIHYRSLDRENWGV